MGAVAAAAILRKEREIVAAYRNARATDPGAARDPSDMGVHQHVAFARLVRRAVLRDAGDGRYYLDEPSWEALRGIRRRMILVVVIVAAIVIVGGIVITGGAAALTHMRTK